MFEQVFQKYLTVKNILFTIGVIFFILFIFSVPEISLMFFAAFVIACSLEPFVKRLMPRFNRSMASVIVLMGAILFICAFFVPLIIIGAHEVSAFAEGFPLYIDAAKNLLDSSQLINLSSGTVNFDIGGIISSITGTTSKLFTETLTAGKNIGSAFVYILVSILIIFYFMSDGEKVKKNILRLFPSNIRGKTASIVDSIAQRSGGYVIAQIITMSSVGIIVSLGLFVLGNEYSLLLGLISAVFDIVPIVGPAVAFVICIMSVIKSDTISIILTALVFATAQLVENNLVRPYVFSKFLDLHPLIIYLFIFIAAKYMGVIGVIFAPAIAATVVVLLEEIYIKNME